jgi:hypothetical protein
LRDQESNPVDLEILYSVGSSASMPVNLIDAPNSGVDSNLTALEASPGAGISHTKLWDYEAQLGSQYGEKISLIFRAGSFEEVIQVSVGNDAPRIEVPAAGVPQQEIVGIAHISFTAFDSSDDRISVRVEYAVADGLDVEGGEDPSEESYLPATSELAPLEGVVASRTGSTLDFLWRVQDDLGSGEHDVVLRLTPIDWDELGHPLTEGQPVLTPLFRIDNNEAPRVLVDGVSFFANPDRRFGIPIPFTVFDEESDPVDVLFQWRRSAQSFSDEELDLSGKSASELRSIMEDPVQRHQYQVCSERPLSYGGTVALVSPVDDPLGVKVRLPEIATTQSALLGRGGVGSRLEILRESRIPQDVSSRWSSGEVLVSPTAALPVGSGLTVLVLEMPTAFQWRLREIELATGVVRRSLVSHGAGEPDCLAWECGKEAILVAAHDAGGLWKVHRLDIQTTNLEELATADPTSIEGPIRGLASIGRTAVLLTVGSTLSRIDYPTTGEPAITVVMGPDPVSGLGGLHMPWGIAVDPQVRQIYLAENTYPGPVEGRVISVQLDGERVTQINPIVDGSLLRRPESLALQDGLLLAGTLNPTTGNQQLRVVNLGSSSVEKKLLTHLSAVGSVAMGDDGLVLLALPETHQLLAGGGVEQERQVSSFDFANQEVVVSDPFDPPLGLGRRWRTRAWTSPLQSRPEGVRRVFLWNSEDVPGGGDVVVRALPLGTEVGSGDDTGIPRTVWSNLRSVPDYVIQDEAIGAAGDILSADLDGDGDFDLVSLGQGQPALLFQDGPGSFGTPPTVLSDPRLSLAAGIAVADLNGDHALDLAVAYEGTDNVGIFFQTAPGFYSDLPLILADGAIDSPRGITSADLDEDGDQDLAVANALSDNLAVFFQVAPGQFALPPLLLSDPRLVAPLDIASVDLDLDGDLDLLSANVLSDNFGLYFQDSPGSFTDVPQLLSAPGIERPARVEVADLDRDGDADLVVTCPLLDTLAVFYLERPGEFGSPVLLRTQDLDRPLAIRVSDLNQDGFLDIVTTSQSDQVMVFYQEPQGQFSQDSLARLDLAFPAGLSSADLDGDGDEDLVAGALDQKMAVYLQKGPGCFSEPALLISENGILEGRAANAADLDQDGDLDLLSVNPNFGTLSVYFQDFSGSFRSPSLLLSDPRLNEPRSATIADLDRDGDLDIVVVNDFYEGGEVALYFQEQPGEFSQPAVKLDHSSVDGTFSVAAADLDQDGGVDLVAANPLSNCILVLLQGDAGTFPTVSAVTDPLIQIPLSIAVGDLDQDGDPDLVVPNSGDDSLVIFFQEAAGVFQSPALRVAHPGLNPNGVKLADLDQDGDLDIAGISSLDLFIFFQNAPGVFSQPLILPTSGNVGNLLVADLDSDGDNDLATTSTLQQGILVFLQGLPGVFPDAPLLVSDPKVGGVTSLSAADVDQDGELDLLGTFYNHIAIFFGAH